MKHSSLAVIALLIAPAPLWAATVPYTNDFSGTGGNVAFPAETAHFSVSGGKYQFTYGSTSLGVGTASVPLTNLGSQPFTVQSDFSISSMGTVNNNGITVGLGLFGASTGFGGANSSSAYYLADWSVANSGTGAGTLRILALGDTSGASGTSVTVDDDSAGAIAAKTNTLYTLKLQGVYAGSTLSMTLGVYDASGNQIGSSATLTDTTPLTGTNFGYRNRVGIGGGSFNAAFDNYSVVVPEPTALAALALAAGGILRRPRRGA